MSGWAALCLGFGIFSAKGIGLSQAAFVAAQASRGLPIGSIRLMI